MRRSNLGRSFDLAAFRFLLALAVVLFFSSNAVAQHSGGGGSSGGGGGGSHGGGSSGGGSSSSGGGHSSGGSGSSGSGGHSSSGHGSSGHASSSGSSSSHSSRTGARETHSDAARSVRENAMRGKTVTEKRGFFSVLRHPFRKPQPKPELMSTVALRRPICFRGPCKVCPTGLARGGGCGGAVVAGYAHNACTTGRAWNGGACLQNHFPYDCNAARVALEQQAQRMHAAEAAQNSTCSTSSGQDCSDRTSASQNETSLYRSLQAQYRACQQRSFGMNPFGHSASGYSHGLSSYPLDFDLEFDSDYR
jgi:hypothetical protein